MRSLVSAQMICPDCHAELTPMRVSGKADFGVGCQPFTATVVECKDCDWAKVIFDEALALGEEKQ